MPDIERTLRDFDIFNEKLCRSNASVILGGRAFQDEKVRKRFSADFYPENFADLSDFAKNSAQK